MPNKKISELTTGTASLTSIIPVSDAGGTVTNKVSVQSLLNADARWSVFLPAAPTSLTATAGSAEVALAWTAPTVLSVTPVTDYIVQYSTNGSTWTTFSDGTSTTTSATVTGLTNGTAYTFRVAAVNNVGTGAYATSGSVTPAADPYFSSVSLLLPGNGNFTDFSPTPTTVTVYGDAVATGSAKYGSNSMVFDGSGDYIAASGSRFAYGTADFTMESWVFVDSHNQQWRGVMGATGAYGGDVGFGLFLTSGTNRLSLLIPYVGGGIEDTEAFPTGQWVHVALVRQSGASRLYKNGVQIGSESMTSNFVRQQFFAGRVYDDMDAQYFAGRLDDIRVTKGVCRYPNGTSFTPPTAAFI